MPKICAVPNCKTGTKGVEEKRSLFRVPVNEEHRRKWQDVIPGKRELKANQSVCERHFLDKDVHKKWIKYDDRGRVIAQYDYPRPRLDARAIPCIFTDETTPDPIDAWTVYKQQKDGIVAAKVLGNSNANAISSYGVIGTMQEVYSTGEHSYCRLELEDGASCTDDRDKIPPAEEETLNEPLKIPDTPAIKSLKPIIDVSQIKEEPPEFMEVEELVDSLTDDESPEETIPSIEKSQRITLTTPNGKTQQLVVKTFVKPSQIKSINPQKSNSTLGHNSGVNTEQVSSLIEENDAGDVEKRSQLQIDTGGVFENGNKLVKLPYTWSVTELVTQGGKQIVFSHVIFTPHNNVETPVLKKSVIIHDRSGTIDYYAHGKLVDVSKTKLPQRVEDITSLQIALYTFQKMRVCGGVAPVNKSRESNNKDIYQDLLQCWRHNDCTVLVDRGKCEWCSKLQKTLAQKRRRAEKNTGSLRISSSWDPMDQVVVLKKKLELERRKRIHAQAQCKKLTEASKENGVKVTFVKNITL